MGGHLKRKRSRLKGMVNRTSPSGGLLIGSDSSEQREVKSIYIYHLQYSRYSPKYKSTNSFIKRPIDISGSILCKWLCY